MKRRQYITAISGSLALVAGCSGESDTPADTPTATTDKVNEQELLNSAYDEIKEAYDVLQSELENFDDVDGRISFQRDVIDAHLDEARNYLENAKEGNDQEYTRQIEVLENTVDWMDVYTGSFENFANAIDEFQTGLTYWENERYQDAANSFSTSSELLGDAEEDLILAQNEFEDIDWDVFEDSDNITRLELKLAMEDLSNYVTDFDYFARTYHYIALGIDYFIPAADAFDNDQYEKAAEGFKNARDEFTTSNSIIREGEGSASDEFIDDFIGLSCLTESFRDAADHFKTASEAAQENNWGRAEEEVNKAQTALDRCDYEAQ